MILALIVFIVSALLSAATFYFGIFPSNGWTWIWFPFLETIALFVAIYMLIMVVSIFYASWVKNNGIEYMPYSRKAQWWLSQWCWFALFFTRTKVHVTGKGRIDYKHRFMMVSNHLSAFDHIAIFARFTHHPLIAVSKKENFQIPFEGGLTKKCGFLPMDRSSMTKGKKIIEVAGEYIKDNVCSVCIAPEGTRNRQFPNPILLPFHPGSFEMAKIAKCQIVVLAIQNTNAVLRRAPFRKTHVYLDVVGVLSYDQYKDMTNAEIAKRCEELILKRFDEKEARFYHLPPQVEETPEESVDENE